MAPKFDTEKMQERQNFRNVWHTDLTHSIQGDTPYCCFALWCDYEWESITLMESTLHEKAKIMAVWTVKTSASRNDETYRKIAEWWDFETSSSMIQINDPTEACSTRKGIPGCVCVQVKDISPPRSRFDSDQMFLLRDLQGPKLQKQL